MTRNRTDPEHVQVRLPAEIPEITPDVARVLLTILVEATEKPEPERASEEVADDD